MLAIGQNHCIQAACPTGRSGLNCGSTPCPPNIPCCDEINTNLKNIITQLVELNACCSAGGDTCKRNVIRNGPTPTTPAASTFYVDSNNRPGLTITKPGRYILCEPICYAPTTGDTNAIFIAANDVVIDMNGCSLTQGVRANGLPVCAPAAIGELTRVAGVSGIGIQNGLQNVTITNVPGNQTNDSSTTAGGSPARSDNGAIRNFTRYGVELFGVATRAGCTQCSRQVVVENLIVSCNDQGGIVINTPTSCAKHENIFVLNSAVDNNGLLGIWLNNVACGEIRKCSASCNKSTGADDTKGIYLSDCDTITVSEVTARGNSSVTGQANGILVENSASIYLDKCVTNFNSASDNASSAVGIGIQYLNTNKGAIRSCLSDSNSTTGVWLNTARLINVSQNQASYNALFGFRDTGVSTNTGTITRSSCNLYTGNFAYHNGNGSTVDLTETSGNFSVSYGGSGGAGDLKVHQPATPAELDKLVNLNPIENVSITPTPGTTCS